MVENRPDWCISRQRMWGVPITVLNCDGCGAPAVDETVFDHIRGIFITEGADAWYMREAKDLLPPGYSCSGCSATSFTKENDILDVWFESGVSHLAVCDTERYGLDWPADLYLEGQDQYRGWFQSSLVASVGLKGAPPFRTVLTHGFVVDAEGHKMSKSIGNVISPKDLVNTYGADILRLWTALADFREDIRISDEIMTRNSEAYRKIRNTLRFLLGNLVDFEPALHMVPVRELTALDAFMLRATERLVEDVKNAYQKYELSTLSHRILNFCTVDLSSLYLDVNKDRLYCDHPDDSRRRATQTVIFRIAEALATLLAPVLSFTAEEVWGHLPGDREDSVHLALFPEIQAIEDTPDNDDAVKRLLTMRDSVLSALEELRQDGTIGKSEEASVTLGGEVESLQADLDVTGIDLARLLIVSAADQGDVGEGPIDTPAYPGLQIYVHRFEAQTCSRCWRRFPELVDDTAMPDLCPRCHDVVGRLIGEGRAELETGEA